MGDFSMHIIERATLVASDFSCRGMGGRGEDRDEWIWGWGCTEELVLMNLSELDNEMKVGAYSG